MSGVLRNNYPSLSRRGFLTTAAGGGGAMLLGPAWLKAAADGVDPRVAQVVSKTIGIDMHNHVHPAGLNRIRSRARRGGRRSNSKPLAFPWQKRSNSQG
jgi:hypothetical protein